MPRIIDIIHRGRTFLITAMGGWTRTPGSELALYAMLTDLRKEAVVYNQDGTRELPLPARERNHRVGAAPAGDVRRGVHPDQKLDRVGREAPRIAGIRQLVNIDHHVPTAVSAIRSCSSGASSTGRSSAGS